MRRFINTYRIQSFLPALLAAAVFLYSCERKNDTINKTEILTLPTQIVKNFETVLADSGRIQLIMSSPLLERFTNTDPPYSEFRSGIRVIFYDGHKEPVATASAKYARFTDKKNLWELRDSVVVVNETNYKLETEQLFWDQDKDIIYTDRFLKITSEDQIIQGSGFESDMRLTKKRIKNVSGPIYLRDE
ncbi:MAG: LPS export ABC transporter periplasmic protein LptC [Bacteroidales bacterium]|nr:LPS export ABC transporter periplasmic protein LptC [Bacteroidales bacterium]